MKKHILSFKSFLLLLITLLGASNWLNAQVSVTATSGTTGPTSYTTVNAAFAAINAGTHQGVIQISVTANTTEPATPVQLLRSGAGSSAYDNISIMPVGNVTINSAATPTASRAILEFIGADSVTIDGDDPATPGARNLTIQMATTTSVNTACIRFSSSSATSDGCRNAVVKNCIIIGGRPTAVATTVSYGIFCGLSTAAATITTVSGAADNDSMLIENNWIQRCYTGIYAYGLAAPYLMDKLIIRNNILGSNVQANNMGLRGIFVANTQVTPSSNSLIIEGNDIQGGDTLTGWSANIAGIDINLSCAGAIIRNNNVHNVEQPTTGGWGAYGIFLSSVTNNSGIHIYNNFIRDIRAFHYLSSFTTFTNFGIYSAAALPGLRITNNTIALLKPNNGSGTSNFSACVALSSTTITLAEFRNNILINKQSDSSGQACNGIYFGSTVPFTSVSFDRNAYFTPGVSGNIGRVATANYQTFAAWKTISLKDSNSFNVDPVFVSNTDLHLAPNLKSILESNGRPVLGYNTDYDGNARPGPAGSVNGGGLDFDIGADEADLLPDAFGYDSSSVTQITAQVPPGSTDNGLLRVAVYVSGSTGTPLTISQLYFNTIGTTAASNIAAAKVFFTGSSTTFNNLNQFGTTVTSPSGQFNVAGTQALAAGVNYFWLAYDVSLTATNTNLLDARVDSIIVAGLGRVPSSNNPAGALQVATPMTYLGMEVTQPELSMVETSSTNNQLLRVMVRMSSSGAPVSISQFSLNANGGGDDTLNIANVKVFYTGSNSNFSAATQFGTSFIQTSPTGTKYGAFNINGILPLANDTNYFWVTYDIKANAIVGDSVDGELVGVTIGGIGQTAIAGAPAGNRKIRVPYCLTTYANGCGTDFIARVRLGNLDNSSGCNGQYTYFSNVTVPNLVPGSTNTLTINYGPDGSQFARAWIDYNADGDFNDVGEDLGIQTPANAGANGQAIINFTVPCSAPTGILRLRVRGGDDSQPNANQSCGASNSGWGEGEDYRVNIVPAVPSYTNMAVNQQTGTTSAGANDVRVLRVPVIVNSSICNPAIMNELRFNTIGTTTAANITNAKLYATRNSGVFAITNLIGTVASPSGQFTFTVADTLNNDTNFYWLTYDVAFGAANNNVLDARLDSINLISAWYVPSNGNPTGNVLISSPMTYVGSSTEHPDLTQVERPSANNRMLRVMVRMSSAGAPVSLTQINLDANGGGDDTSNIENVKIFATGSNPNFSIANQFGSTFVQTTPTANKYGAFNITGLQTLLNDTNYFWVTYNIKPTAILFDSVDVECTGLTIAGTPQVPSVTAPAGNRKIRAVYCASNATSTADEEIWNVTIGTLNNTSNCTTLAPGANSVVSQYSNYSGFVAAPNLPAGINIPFSVNAASCGGNFTSRVAIFIDYNQNGTFDLPGEQAYITPTSFVSSNVGAAIQTGTINIPCTAIPGVTRMRVILVETTGAITPCGTYTWGETEDYDVNIVNSAPVYNASNTIQQTGTTSAGATDVRILRIPIKVSSSACTPGTVTQFNFRTNGTTTAANILTAKLYSTGSSNVFNNTKLVGSASAPSGSFIITTNDTLINDTNNYWLAYDVSFTAANNNVLDAIFDSAQVYTNWVQPIVANPTGNVLISSPVTYVNSSAAHMELSMVETGSTNNRMLRVMVRMSSAGAPVSATQINLDAAGGGNDTANIANAKVFFTGNSPVFATTSQFGSNFVQTAPTGASWGTFNITGLATLNPDTNYFWVTYDIKGAAVLGDSVDVSCTGITVAGVNQTPTVTSLAGNRKIRQPYCTTGAQFTGDGEILNVTLSTLNNTTTCTSVATGPGSALSLYNNYAESVVAPQINAGERVSFSVHTSTCNGNWDGVMGIWIDLNQDGDFTDAGETVVMTQSFLYGNGIFQTGSFYLPLNALPGRTRMRVTLNETTFSPITPCGLYFYGETEDYTIEVLPTTNASYVWNQTAGGNFATAANWTPNRNKLNLSDRLSINTGNAATFTGLISENVRGLALSNNTQATFANAAAELAVSDTITLGNSARITTNNNILTLGFDTTQTGSVSLGATAGINGNLKRWFNSSFSNISFPLVNATGVTRNLTVSYTALPTVMGSLIGSFNTTAAGNLGLPLYDSTAFLTVNKTGINGFWGLTAANGTTAGTYEVNLNATAFAGVNSFSNLVALRRVDATSAWASIGIHAPATGSNAAPVVNRTAINVYGQFTIAGDSITNPLPVELLSFKGNQVNGDAQLSWTTSSETNNRGFTLERSVNNVDFREVTFVKGAGNSKTIRNYAYTDVQPFSASNVLYYRLVQEDFDGTTTYSNTVSVSISEALEEGILVYPNPFNEGTGIFITSVDKATAQIEIVDIMGRTVASQKSAIVAGSQYVNLGGLNLLTSGVYFVRVNIGNTVKTSKIQKVD
ncbi:MAG: T9SS type A sorting domain-containing protein [Bacteroidetes bacterium]|nr:T9SS type A sorting domain-containing protein [Bacteroidota bacterium]